MKNALLFLCLLLLNVLPAQTPIARGHAHNDYQHSRPLFEALENGFTSIEIDVYLHNGKLIVSHEGVGLDSKPDIETLYLNPIKKRIEENGGNVYKGGTTPVIFMIDFKTSGDETYAKLKEVLQGYANLLTVYKGTKVIKQGALQILVSGSKPFTPVMAEKECFATIDAEIAKLDDDEKLQVSTRVSDNWGKHFLWNGKGKMPEFEKHKLDSLVAKAHSKGMQIRFYGAPDNAIVWKTLLDAGVDWINTDKLAEYRKFWEGYKGK